MIKFEPAEVMEARKIIQEYEESLKTKKRHYVLELGGWFGVSVVDWSPTLEGAQEIVKRQIDMHRTLVPFYKQWGIKGWEELPKYEIFHLSENNVKMAVTCGINNYQPQNHMREE